MKVLILLTIAAVAVAYTTVDDNLDMDAIVANDEKLRSYNDCFIDVGPCDHIQAHFKNDLPEAIREACAKCTEAQKVIFKKYLVGLQQKQPQNFEKFKNKYDPKNQYFPVLISAISAA